MHLATAVGTPTVALFGSTDPEVTGPYDETSHVIYKKLACAPCLNHPTCGGRYDCLTTIAPDEVVFAVRDLIRRNRGSATPFPMMRAPELDDPIPARGAKGGMGRAAFSAGRLARTSLAAKFKKRRAAG
jgi:hypothetical protein